MNTAITSKSKERLDALKQAITEGIAVCLIVGSALREIKESELYKIEGHKTFDDFCETEWGWTRRYCNQLIVDAKLINSLPPAMRKLITSHDGARQLAKIPEHLRVATLERAAGNGEIRVSGPAIRKAAPRSLPEKKPTRCERSASTPPPRKAVPASKPGPKPKPPTDETGVEIPKEILEIWGQADNDVNETILYIKSVKVRLASAEKSGDKIWLGTNFNSALAACSQLLADVEAMIPYAVCPSCNGVMDDKNCSCKGKGFVGKFFWDKCIPEEIKQMRKV